MNHLDLFLRKPPPFRLRIFITHPQDFPERVQTSQCRVSRAVGMDSRGLSMSEIVAEWRTHDDPRGKSQLAARRVVQSLCLRRPVWPVFARECARRSLAHFVKNHVNLLV